VLKNDTLVFNGSRSFFNTTSVENEQVCPFSTVAARFPPPPATVENEQTLQFPAHSTNPATTTKLEQGTRGMGVLHPSSNKVCFQQDDYNIYLLTNLSPPAVLLHHMLRTMSLHVTFMTTYGAILAR
jgi:hypothetical protein